LAGHFQLPGIVAFKKRRRLCGRHYHGGPTLSAYQAPARAIQRLSSSHRRIRTCHSDCLMDLWQVPGFCECPPAQKRAMQDCSVAFRKFKCQLGIQKRSLDFRITRGRRSSRDPGSYEWLGACPPPKMRASSAKGRTAVGWRRPMEIWRL
jgi:hypothetical protein